MRRPSRLPTNLTHEDRVVLFPSLGHLSRDGRHWVISVHGDIHAAGRISLDKRVLLKLLQRTMQVPNEAFATELFQQRISRFVAIDRPGRRVALRIADQVYTLPKCSRRNGHFQSAVRIPASLLGAGVASLPLDVCTSDQVIPAVGRAYLLASQGLSVISDIDDTLKHSFVACKRTLLCNTFLRPFETIPGMAPLFQQWSESGATFHYVSSSPWQLYEHLETHLAAEGFPPGSFHLRAFRLRDHLMRRVLMLRRSGKATVIRSMIKTFPERRFLLVGDSGEIDPEIYGAMARRFPDQIAGILIRQIEGRRNSAARYARAFRGVPASLVRLFREPHELESIRLVP